MSYTHNIIAAIACMLIIAGFGLTVKPLFLSYMNKYIESDNRATVLSAVSMARSIVTAAANIVFGYFVDINMRYTLFALGIITLVFAFASRVTEEHLKD